MAATFYAASHADRLSGASARCDSPTAFMAADHHARRPCFAWGPDRLKLTMGSLNDQAVISVRFRRRIVTERFFCKPKRFQTAEKTLEKCAARDVAAVETVSVNMMMPFILNRHSPDGRRFKPNSNLCGVLRRPGSPPTSSRTVLERAEVNPNGEIVEFSVIETLLT